jgi:hypothetical protein
MTAGTSRTPSKIETKIALPMRMDRLVQRFALIPVSLWFPVSELLNLPEIVTLQV